MKRLIKKSSKNYVEEYDIEEMKKINTDIGSWISGGRSWFDNPDEEVKKWMQMFPEYVYHGKAYRVLAFTEGQLENSIKQVFNIDDLNNDEIQITKNDLDTICSKMIYASNDYVSWTINFDSHMQFHDFHKDFNGSDYNLFSIESDVEGFYVTKFNQYLYENLDNKTKEQYDKESLDMDGVDYSAQDEVIAPTPNFNLKMINQINADQLINISLSDFISKIKS